MLSGIRRTHFLFFFLLSLSMAITSCGGGGNSSPTVQSNSIETGNVAVLLTDGPTDHFSAVNVTVTGIELLSNHGKVQIFSGEKTIDLLKLQDESTLFSVATDVPTDEYNKIRLHISHVELIPLDTEEEIIIPKMGGNGKLDLNPRSPFRVKPGETLIMQIDLDAEKSLHIHETGNGEVQFRPVVFIDIVDGIFAGKLVRLEGFAADLNFENKTFQLCPHEEEVQAHASSIDDSDDRQVDRCVQIFVSENTSLFDMIGDPAEFGDLNVDNYVSVLGHFRNSGDEMDDDTMGFNAEIIEIGGMGAFLRLSGTILSAPNESGAFSFALNPGQGIVETDLLTVLLQKETKIYSDSGIQLTGTDIEVGLIAKIDGILVISDTEPDFLKAGLIVLETNEAPELMTVHGTASNIGDRIFDLSLSESETLCITVPVDTLIFLKSSIGIEGEMEGNVPFDFLKDGDKTEVQGYEDDTDCFIAELMWIIVDDEIVIE